MAQAGDGPTVLGRISSNHYKVRFREAERVHMGLFSMIQRRKSYSDEDAYLVAMRWREIESQAEEAARAIPEGMIKWIKNEENKRKYFKALGIHHGFIHASFQGDSQDFDQFLGHVVIKAHDHGLFMRYGKGIVKEHLRLRKRLDPDYFDGIKLGQRQVAEGINFYLEHRKTW